MSASDLEDRVRQPSITALLQELVTLQREQNRKLDVLTEAIQTKSRRPIRRHVVSAIATAVHGHVFSAAEVILHAETDPALAAALDVARITSAKELGGHLLTLESRNIDGLRLVRIGKDRDGVIWQIGS